MNQPLVSVVIPAYNHWEYLEEAINSVLAQDYPELELIVIDDGSTDRTPEILASIDGDFVQIRHENMGQAKTLEKGWAIARGEILGYLSADDALEPDAVSRTIEVFNARPDIVATYPDFKLIDPSSKLVRQVSAPDYDFEKMLTDVVCYPGPGAFFRRRAYEQAGPWNPMFRQMPDYDFWLRLGLVGPFLRIGRQLASFRVHEGSQTYSKVSEERAEEPLTIVRNVLSSMDLPAHIKARRYTVLANATLVSAQLHARSGRLGQALRAVCFAWSLSPRTVFSRRSLKMIVNATLNRIGHMLLWRYRRS